MNEIAAAFSQYDALLNNLEWLQENNQLPPETDIGLLAFQGAIAHSSTVVIEAFVAAMEIVKADSERKASEPRRLSKQAKEEQSEIEELARRELFKKAKSLASVQK